MVEPFGKMSDVENDIAVNSWRSKAVGVSLSLFGIGLISGGEVVRHGVKLSTTFPDQSGVNWDYYYSLVNQFGRPVIDGLISYGLDLGGMLLLIGLTEFVSSIEDSAANTWKQVGLISTAFFGAFGMLIESGELIRNIPAPECMSTGCGDIFDLLLFMILTSYPYIKSKLSQNNQEEAESTGVEPVRDYSH